jgi:hypothetical protein
MFGSIQDSVVLARFAMHIPRAAANSAIGDEFREKCRNSAIAEFREP